MSDVQISWINNNKVKFEAVSDRAKALFVEIFEDVEVRRYVTPDLRQDFREQLEKEFGLECKE